MNPLRQLRVIGISEGISFLLLLFVAMPLKYLLEQPGAVRVVGMVHGVLFILYVVGLYRAAMARDWPLRRTALAFVASVVPFGFFFFDPSLRREIAAPVPGVRLGS